MRDCVFSSLRVYSDSIGITELGMVFGLGQGALGDVRRGRVLESLWVYSD